MIKIDLIDISIQARPYDDHTDVREFGRTLSFNKGLNLVVGDNTSGKTTLVRSLFYCLGMEELIDGKPGDKSLDKSVKDQFSYTDAGGVEKTWYINSSYVVVQISNERGEILTVKREIKSDDKRDNVLSVWKESYRPNLDSNGRREYYVHRPDDHNPDYGTGFYALLSEFGNIPIIDVPGRNTDAGTKLYLQTIFGLTFVEQTRGWSDFFANIRSFNIISPKQRIIEYAMNYAMDADMATTNSLREKMKHCEEEWQRQASNFGSYLAYNKLYADKLSPKIDKQEVPVEDIRIGVRDRGCDIATFKHGLEERITALDEKASTIDAPHYDQGYQDALGKYQEHKKSYEQFCFQLAEEKRKLDNIKQQVASLDNEIKRYQSLGRVNNIVSNLDVHYCPTCHQTLPVSEATFAVSQEQISSSLHVLDMQRRFLKPMIDKLEVSIQNQEMNKLYLENQLAVELESLNAIAEQKQINMNPLSVAEQYELVDSRSRLALLGSIEMHIDQTKQDLAVIKSQYDDICGKLDKQKNDKKQETPLQKQIDQFRKLLACFGYRSNGISSVFFSEEKNTYQYLPIIEQGDYHEEIRSDSSASDFIRSIWAYYLTLLIEGVHHPGFLVMDEPCQHSMKEESLKRLFEVCSRITDKQIILFCSSQPHTEESVERERQGQAATNIIQTIVNSMSKTTLSYQIVDPKSIIEKTTEESTDNE